MQTTFGKTLQKIRRGKGKSQRSIADIIEMDYAYFSRLENDRFDYKPSRETVERIAQAMECDEGERGELLAAAGRIDEEVEQVARMTNEKPQLKQLFRAAAKLSPERLQELIDMAQKKQPNSTKRKQESD